MQSCFRSYSRSINLIPPRFDYKAAGTTFGTTYIPYIFSTRVIFMNTLDTFHALDLFPQTTITGRQRVGTEIW